MRKDVLIMLIIAALVIGGGVILFLKDNSQKTSQPGARPDDQSAIVRTNNHSRGSASAKVTIVEFGDYQCPACGYINPVVNQIAAKYQSTNQVRLVYRNFPLTQIHKNAMLSAEAAEAAGLQGKFWEMHDKLYETQSQWSELTQPLDFFKSLAGQIGLDVNQFMKAVQSPQILAIVRADAADAAALNLPGTPTFFINGRQLQNIPSFAEFSQLIDVELKK